MGIKSETIVWDGRTSEDLNLIIASIPSYVVPERKMEVISVPGRNGDIIIAQDAYNNVTVKYDLAIVGLNKTLNESVAGVMEWLMKPVGYARLENSYDPDCFRIGFFKNAKEVVNRFMTLGRATVEFSCKPQRFLRVGELPIIAVNGMRLSNPSVYTANPLIAVRGASEGVLTVGDVEVEISGFGTGGEIDIDSESMSAFYGSANLNSLISLDNGKFPILPEGETEISWTGGITSVVITPRWWIL